jgi:hypothetical protein
VTNIESLLGAVLGVPALPGAKCRGRSHVFNEAEPGESREVVEQRHTQAKLICSGCPALTPCRDWVNSLTPPARRPSGIVAGRLIKTPKPGKPHGTRKFQD